MRKKHQKSKNLKKDIQDSNRVQKKIKERLAQKGWHKTKGGKENGKDKNH